MNKLEIKHLAPYLPYGVRIKTQEQGEFIIKEVDGVYKQYKDGAFKLYWEENLGTTQISGYLKLVLRPLTSLCDPLPNGEIPAIELAKLNLAHKPTRNYLLVDNDGNAVIEYRIITKPFGKVLKVTNADSWIVYAPFSKMENLAYFQMEYLFKNHFDVFGLIEKGLAIDKNTIE